MVESQLVNADHKKQASSQLAVNADHRAARANYVKAEPKKEAARV